MQDQYGSIQRDFWLTNSAMSFEDPSTMINIGEDERALLESHPSTTACAL